MFLVFQRLQSQQKYVKIEFIESLNQLKEKQHTRLQEVFVNYFKNMCEIKTLFNELCSKTSLSQHETTFFNFLAISLMKDENADVRSWVTSRIDPKFLPEMMKDENSNVRWEVAHRMKT